MHAELQTKPEIDEGLKPRLIPHVAFYISNLFRRYPCIPLALITIFAAVIRFTRLRNPPLWFDESMVFWRTCGTYGQLLDCLRTDGFVPLHYSLIWVLTRFVRPTPFALRFIPALSGTLMVPAVYLLARQLLPKTTSLLAAAVTASSAFMLFYSRDAKMYMDSWLFVTLNVGCLLWWFRTNRSTAWLCWIAAGCTACGLHISSMIPVALSLLLLFSQTKMRWQQTLLWLTGVALISAGPIVHYTQFNLWVPNIEEEGWKKSQLEWINAFNYGRTGTDLVRFLGTCMVMGWEWPRVDAIQNFPKMQSTRFSIPSATAFMILGILIIAALPWPRRWRGRDSAGLDEPPPQPQWRTALWLSLWIVLPVYGFYCRSMPGFAEPSDWWSWATDACPLILLPVRHHWVWAPIGIFFAGLIYLAIRFRIFRPAMFRGIALLAVIAAVIGLCSVMDAVLTAQAKAAMEAHKPWESLWVPRYMGFVWPAAAIAIAALLMRLPTWPVRWLGILFFITVNLWIASRRIYGQTEPPVQEMARDWVTGRNPANHTLTLNDLDRGTDAPGGGNLFSGPGEYYVEMLSKPATDPVAFKKAMSVRMNSRRDFLEFFGADIIPADVNQVIAWKQYAADGPTAEDDLWKRMSGWRLESDQKYVVQDCWIWKDIAMYERRVYVREEHR